jgi:hypothetical protein
VRYLVTQWYAAFSAYRLGSYVVKWKYGRRPRAGFC